MRAYAGLRRLQLDWLFSQSHIDYVIEVCAAVSERAAELTGLRIVDEPAQLRHFTARFQRLG